MDTSVFRTRKIKITIRRCANDDDDSDSDVSIDDSFSPDFKPAISPMKEDELQLELLHKKIIAPFLHRINLKILEQRLPVDGCLVESITEQELLDSLNTPPVLKLSERIKIYMAGYMEGKSEEIALYMATESWSFTTFLMEYGRIYITSLSDGYLLKNATNESIPHSCLKCKTNFNMSQICDMLNHKIRSSFCSECLMKNL